MRLSVAGHAGAHEPAAHTHGSARELLFHSLSLVQQRRSPVFTTLKTLVKPWSNLLRTLRLMALSLNSTNSMGLGFGPAATAARALLREAPAPAAVPPPVLPPVLLPVLPVPLGALVDVLPNPAVVEAPAAPPNNCRLCHDTSSCSCPCCASLVSLGPRPVPLELEFDADCCRWVPCEWPWKSGCKSHDQSSSSASCCTASATACASAS